MSEMCLHSCVLIVFLRPSSVILYMLLLLVVMVFVILSIAYLVCNIFFSFGTITTYWIGTDMQFYFLKINWLGKN